VAQCKKSKQAVVCVVVCVYIVRIRIGVFILVGAVLHMGVFYFSLCTLRVLHIGVCSVLFMQLTLAHTQVAKYLFGD